MFKNKNLLITGGTGTFGNAVLRRFIRTEIREIRVFARDEKKQEDMRISYKNPKLKFYIGDVRFYDSVASAMAGVDYVFHAAALKQVPEDLQGIQGRKDLREPLLVQALARQHGLKARQRCGKPEQRLQRRGPDG
jgi:uncharacterized protein YbjT (DUF2867 family)